MVFFPCKQWTYVHLKRVIFLSLRKCRKIPIIIKHKIFEFNYNTKVHQKKKTISSRNDIQPIVCYLWSVSLIKKIRTRFQSWSVAKKVFLILSFIITWDLGKPYIFFLYSFWGHLSKANCIKQPLWLHFTHYKPSNHPSIHHEIENNACSQYSK